MYNIYTVTILFRYKQRTSRRNLVNYIKLVTKFPLKKSKRAKTIKTDSCQAKLWVCGIILSPLLSKLAEFINSMKCNCLMKKPEKT